MILEGLLTTLNADGSVNLAPMGPQVDWPLTRLVVKPYQTSTTYRNLKRTGQGVFHVTDDVELIARAAVGALNPLPPLLPARGVEGWVIADACRWYAIRVASLDDSDERTRIECQVVDSGTLRDFFGFNRARHAVLEAAILATRVDRLPAAEVLGPFEQFDVLVRKTGGPAERRALDLLAGYVRAHYAADVDSLRGDG